jgi:hypothetical protein
MNKKQLLEVKEKIDTAKAEILHMEGQKDAVEKQLLKQTNSTTLKQVKEKLQAKRLRFEAFTERINKNLALIEEQYFK